MVMWYIYLCFAAFVTSILAAPEADRVIILPGLPSQPKFRHYSGYLEGSPTARLHYWFVESQNKPSTDPVVLWLNGGPGCSSMEGFLAEHGPFMLNDVGIPVYNNHSWNKVANMLYLEAPAGVGYSYSTDGNVTTDDDLVSLNNYRALLQFFKKFPEFRTNDFFLTGESYGGFYIPTLAVRVSQDTSFNFKGMAIGNALSSWSLNTNSLIYFAHFHGLIGSTLWNKLHTNCCSIKLEGYCQFIEVGPSCAKIFNEVSEAINGLDIYNLYAPCAGGVGQETTNQKAPKDDILRFSSLFPARKIGSRSIAKNNLFGVWQEKSLKTRVTPRQLAHQNLIRGFKSVLGNSANLKLDIPCTDDHILENYMNTPEVRYALHIDPVVPKWEVCSGPVSSSYKTIYANMTAQYLHILANKKYRTLIYNGDIDMACNFLGDEIFFNSLGQKVFKEYSKWYFISKDGTKQIGGYTKSAANGAITFLTVRGAGHMVPTDKPRQAYTMFTRFLSGHSY